MSQQSVEMPQAAQHLKCREQGKMPLTAEQLHRMEQNRLAALEKKRRREEGERVSKFEEARAIKKQKINRLFELLHNPSLGDKVREIVEDQIEELADDLRPIEAALKAARGEGNSSSLLEESHLEKPLDGRQSAKNGGHDAAPIQLSLAQQQVVEQAEQGKNIFLTGCGGTGKSFLMHKVIKKLKTIKTKFKYGQVAVTATTGLAATNIGGVTLHTYFGLGNGDGTVDELYRKISRTASYPGGAYNKWMRVRALVVDEVSMLDGNLFDKIEALARKFKGNDRPFGGIQLLLVGDFLQLPPVGKNGAVKFAFEAKSWDKCVDVHVELKEVFRQSDKAFVSALNSIRWGKVTPEVTAMLTEASKTTFDPNSDIKPTMLYPMNAQIDKINWDELKALPNQQYTFHSVDDGTQYFRDQLDKNCLAPKVLVLKVGAQVMLLKNSHSHEGLCNGSRGVVREVYDHLIVCEFENARGEFVEAAIVREDFSIQMKDGQNVTRTVAERHQFPLRLAYAITIHKCQGMTLSKVEMSLKNVFEHGQAYVALSRASSLKGLRVKDWDPSVIRAHPRVVDFYSKMGATPSLMIDSPAVTCHEEHSCSKGVEAQNLTNSEPMIEDVSCPSNGPHVMEGVEDIGCPTDHYVEDVSFPSTWSGVCKQQPMIEDVSCAGQQANAVIEDVSCPSAEKVANNMAISVDSSLKGDALFSPEASTIASQDSAVATQPKSPQACLLNEAQAFLSETKERLFAPKSPSIHDDALAKTCSPSQWNDVQPIEEIPVHPGYKQVQGSGSNTYNIHRTAQGNRIICSCPAWKHAKYPFSGAEGVKTCKHIKGVRGEAAEEHRITIQLQEVHLQLYKFEWPGAALDQPKPAKIAHGKKKKGAEQDADQVGENMPHPNKAAPKEKPPPKEKAPPKAKAPPKEKAPPKAKAPPKEKAAPKAKPPPKEKAPPMEKAESKAKTVPKRRASTAEARREKLGLAM